MYKLNELLLIINGDEVLLIDMEGVLSIDMYLESWICIGAYGFYWGIFSDIEARFSLLLPLGYNAAGTLDEM